MKNEFDAYARVRELAAERNMTISCLARTCGLNPSTIYVTKKRNGQMKLDTIMRICDGLGMQLGEFFTPPNSDAPSTPVCRDLRQPGCGTRKDLSACVRQISDNPVSEYVRLPVRIFGEDPLAIGFADGNGMSDFSILDGDTFFISTGREPKPGDVVLVNVEGMGYMMRQLLIDEETGAYRLHASGKDPREDLLCNEMEIYGVLSHVMRNLEGERP